MSWSVCADIRAFSAFEAVGRLKESARDTDDDDGHLKESTRDTGRRRWSSEGVYL